MKKKYNNKWINRCVELNTPFCDFAAPYISDDYAHIFNSLQKCRCCKRHQQRRPKGLTTPYVNDYINMEQHKIGFGKRSDSCQCICRFWMRKIYFNYSQVN